MAAKPKISKQLDPPAGDLAMHDIDAVSPRNVTVRFDAPLPDDKPLEKVNIRDVAREAGVSVATVSMVLNDNPRISRGTQVRVQKMIERLGYRPNRLAQGLSSKYTQVLAVMLPPLRIS